MDPQHGPVRSIPLSTAGPTQRRSRRTTAQPPKKCTAWVGC